MTDTARLDLATDRPRVIVGTDGLLAAFNDAGVLNPLDVASAATIGRLLGETDQQVLLAAALAVRGTRYGHVCIRLDTVREAVAVDGQDPAEIEALPWPDLDPWTEAVASSPLVGDGTTDTPLVFSDGRLYLERYFRYEEQIANLITQRLTRSGPPGGAEGVAGIVPPEGERRWCCWDSPPGGGKVPPADGGGRG